jgi:hypothetical protein
MEANQKENKEHIVSIDIETTRGKWDKATFEKTAKIQEVIQATVQHFGYAQNGKYEMRLKTNPDQPLKPERTLESYKIDDGSVLIFTDLGVGVCQ